jgi:hypothetical protein
MKIFFFFYRVRVERQGGAWCPKNQITSEAEEWLQVRNSLKK